MVLEHKTLPQRPDGKDKLIALIAFIILIWFISPIQEIAIWTAFAKKLRSRKFV